MLMVLSLISCFQFVVCLSLCQSRYKDGTTAIVQQPVGQFQNQSRLQRKPAYTEGWHGKTPSFQETSRANPAPSGQSLCCPSLAQPAVAKYPARYTSKAIPARHLPPKPLCAVRSAPDF